MKKIVSFVLMLILVMQIGYVQNALASEITYNADELSKAVCVLNNLGILSLQEETSIWQDKSISRAEFADYICKAFKLDANTGNVYFTDVPYDMWAYNSVTSLAEAGCISVPENRIFRPDDTITYAEALKIILTAANYDIYAEYNGGFPYGYIVAAQRMKLDVSASMDAGMTVAAAVNLIYDVLSMGFYEPLTYSESGTSEYRETEDTIFEILWDTCIERGYLKAYYGASYKATADETNEVVIDDVRYTMAEEVFLDDYFLNEVEFIYKKSKDKPGNIIYIEDSGENDDIIIESDDLIEFDSESYSVSYYKGDKKQQKTLDRGTLLMYNGAVYGGSISDALNEFVSGDKRGSIRLKDFDGTGGIDTVIVKAYRNFAVGYADLNAEKLYNKLDGADCIDMSAYEQVLVRSLENENTSLDFSTLPVLLNVAEAKDGSSLELVVCREKLVGSPENISSNNMNTIFTIGGREYKLDYLMYKKQMLDENGNPADSSALFGTKYEFYIDKFGYIGFMNALGAGDGYSIGYMMDGACDRKGLNHELLLKILTETGDIVEYGLGEKVTVDGVSYKTSDYEAVMNALENGAVKSDTAVDGAVSRGHLSEQLIRYIVSTDNIITKIDTAFVGDTENADNTLTILPVANGIERTMYHVTGGLPKFGTNILFSTTDTKVFSKPLVNDNGNLVVLTEPAATVTENVMLPSDSGNFPKKTVVTDTSGAPAMPEDEMYKSGIPEGAFSGDIGYYTRGYKFNPNTPYCDALVYSYGVWYSKLENVFFDEIREAYNEDDEVVKKIYVWDRGVRIGYEVGDGSDVSDFERGDILYCWTDCTNTKLGFIKKIYDVGDDVFLNRPYTESSTRTYPEYMWIRGYWSVNASTGEITSYTYRSKNSVTKGKVLGKTGTAIRWDWDGDYRTFEEIFDFSNVPIVIYDKNEEKNSIFLGSVADVPDYESVGDSAARIVMVKDRERGVCAYIYLND